MARNAVRFAPHAHTLYAAFIGHEKRHDIRRVARLMGIAPETLYSYCHNTESMGVDLVAALYSATRDLQLLSELLGLGDVGLTVTEDPGAETPEGIRDHALRAGASVGAVQSSVLKALDDGDVNALEVKEISRAIEAAERNLETLRKAAKLKVAT